MATRDPKTWMWAEACEFLERAERLQRQFFQIEASTARRPSWVPPVDVFEAGSELSIVVALPGVAAGRVEVRIEEGLLIVTGWRRLPLEVSGATVHRLEIPHGRFERQVELPPGCYEFLQQDQADGCLTLRLRRR